MVTGVCGPGSPGHRSTLYHASQNKFLKKTVSIDTLVAGVVQIPREGLHVLAHA